MLKFAIRFVRPYWARGAFVVVAHRLGTVRKADLIFVMNEGRVVERGTYDELLALRRLY